MKVAFIIFTVVSVSVLAVTVMLYTKEEKYMERPTQTQDGLQDLSMRAFSAKPHPPGEQEALLASIDYLEEQNENRDSFYVSFATSSPDTTEIIVYLTHKSLYTDEGLRMVDVLGDPSGKSREIVYDTVTHKITNVTFVR